MNDTSRYTERTSWPGWVEAVFWGSILVAVLPLVFGPGGGLGSLVRLLIGAWIVGFAVTVRAVVAGLTVHLRDHDILVHLGSVPLIKRVVKYSEIEEMEATDYRPLADYGGWGVRGWGKKKAWTARGDKGVQLYLTGNRMLLIGSDHPQRLEERMRAIAGDQIGGADSAD